MKRIFGLVLISMLFLCSCQSYENRLVKEDTNPCEKEVFAMDTIMQITLYGDHASAVMNDVIARIHELENKFSVTKMDSDVSKLNAANGQAVTVSDETYELLQRCLELSEDTDGLFDISIYPLVKAWGFTTEEYKIPTENEIRQALSKVDYKQISLLGENKVRLRAGMEIDLGAAAKGYLSQNLMELLKEKGITSAIVSLGGNVQALGAKENTSSKENTSFVVGITDPADGSSLYGTLNVENKAVITSGTYQRYFEKDGKKYHHIMDKRTGKPAENTLASVTVIAEDGVLADSLATALYVMGDERAKEYQKNHAEIELILIYQDGTYWQSDGAGMKRTEKEN